VNPRGLTDPAGLTEPRTISLPEGTPVTLLFRDPVFSKDVFRKDRPKDGAGTQFVFEVAADVRVDGAVLIRKGALGVGRLTDDAKSTGKWGRAADLAFVIDHVTAVDGQSVAVVGAAARQRQRDVAVSSPANVGLLGYFLVGVLTKGPDSLVRAGTAFDTETSGAHSVKVGR
jgi:hypothetical protein